MGYDPPNNYNRDEWGHQLRIKYMRVLGGGGGMWGLRRGCPKLSVFAR